MITVDKNHVLRGDKMIGTILLSNNNANNNENERERENGPIGRMGGGNQMESGGIGGGICTLMKAGIYHITETQSSITLYQWTIKTTVLKIPSIPI